MKLICISDASLSVWNESVGSSSLLTLQAGHEGRNHKN